MNKRIQYRQMENLLKKMNEKIDSQNRKIESQSEILQEFIGLLNAKQREGEDFEKFLRELALWREDVASYLTANEQEEQSHLIFKRLDSIFEEMGVKIHITKENSAFDSKIHEVIDIVETEEEEKHARIAKSIRNGYEYHGKIWIKEMEAGYKDTGGY